MFLYRLEFWEVRRIISGYRRRQYEAWVMIRQHAFWTMHNGMADLSKAGITEPTDLISFPQDEQDGDDGDDETPDSEEVRQMLSHLRELNEENERNKASLGGTERSGDTPQEKKTTDH